MNSDKIIKYPLIEAIHLGLFKISVIYPGRFPTINTGKLFSDQTRHE